MHHLPRATILHASYGMPTWSRWPRRASAARLHRQHRAYVILTASEMVRANAAPHWLIVDTHGDGCAAYRQTGYSLVPALTDWQAGVIDAIRHLRRWRYYGDSPD